MFHFEDPISGFHWSFTSHSIRTKQKGKEYHFELHNQKERCNGSGLSEVELLLSDRENKGVINKGREN